MRKEIYKVLYGYALECKSKKQIEKKEKNRNEHSTEKRYRLSNESKNLQKNR